MATGEHEISSRLLKAFRITFFGLGLVYALVGVLSGKSQAGAGPDALTCVAFYSASMLVLCGLFVRKAAADLAFAVALVAFAVPLILVVAERFNGSGEAAADPGAFRIERVNEGDDNGSPAVDSDILRSSIYAPHGEHGWVHIPGSRGSHKTDNFDVVYTIDERGNRLTPDPLHAEGEIVLLGGSYTFGWGIDDKRNYPWILGEKYWCDYKLVNRACNGWGTAQAYQVLQQELARDDPPDAIVYAWVTLHIGRNYLSRAWLDQIAKSGAMNPWFEMEEGRLVFKGVAGPERGMAKAAGKAKEITIELVEEMHRLAAEKNVPFFILLLPVRKPFENEEWFVEELDKRGIGYLNALHLREGFPYETDGHPGPEWHAHLAGFLARQQAFERFSAK